MRLEEAAVKGIRITHKTLKPGGGSAIWVLYNKDTHEWKNDLGHVAYPNGLYWDWEEYREPDHIPDTEKKVSAWKKFTDEKPELPGDRQGIIILVREITEYPARFVAGYEREDVLSFQSKRLDQSQYEWTEIPE